MNILHGPAFRPLVHLTSSILRYSCFRHLVFSLLVGRVGLEPTMPLNMSQLHFHCASLVWLRWADSNCRLQSMNLVRDLSSTARYSVRGFRALSVDQDVKRSVADLNSHQPDGTPRRIWTLTNRGPWPRALSVMLWAHIKGSYKTLTGVDTSRLELTCRSLMEERKGFEPSTPWMQIRRSPN